MRGMTVKALVADCVIGGKSREIRYASAGGHGDLIIKGLTIDEAMDVLRTATGDMVEAPKSTTVAPPPAPTPAPTSARSVVEAPPEPAEPELVVADEPATENDPLPTTSPEAKVHPENVQPEPASTNGKGNGDNSEQDPLIAQLQGHKRILHIVNVLVENGFKTSEQVLAKCQEFRAHVPALERITPSDFDERIKRVYEVLDAGAAG